MKCDFLLHVLVEASMVLLHMQRNNIDIFLTVTQFIIKNILDITKLQIISDMQLYIPGMLYGGKIKLTHDESHN